MMAEKESNSSQPKIGSKRAHFDESEVQKDQEKWNKSDTTRLLEGIRRFGADNVQLVACHVKTRTVEEVEAFIEHLRRNETRPENKKRRDAFGEVYKAEAEPNFQDFFMYLNPEEELNGFVKKSPIEAWTELITELTFYEPHDYSQEVTKVFSVIARNEEFEPSGIPRLNWRKIYKFIADMLEDKAEIQELSDVESHIVLDMMHRLGEEIHSSDTKEQQSLLVKKFALLNTLSCSETDIKAIRARRRCYRKAFTNDYYESDDNSPEDTNDPKSRIADTNIKASTSSQNQNIKTSTSSQNLDKDQLKTTPSSLQLNDLGADSELPNPESMYTDNAEENSTDKADSGKDKNDCTWKTFKKPPLFSLNPLCIPTSMLSLKKRVKY